MTGFDWLLLALLALGAILALRHIRRHGACGGSCENCARGQTCRRKPSGEAPPKQP